MSRIRSYRRWRTLGTSAARDARMTNIGIIGAGSLGQAFAKQFVEAGYDVVLSNSRGPASLSGLTRELGPHAQAGTAAEERTHPWCCWP
jgi:lactate dehydrogenase-like 2-hydroxyacid dehydrogenase